MAVWTHAGIETAFARTGIARTVTAAARVQARSDERERAESIAHSHAWTSRDTGCEAAVDAAAAGSAVPMPLWMRTEGMVTDLWLEIGAKAPGG